MDNKQDSMNTLADIHAKLCLLTSGIIGFEDWRKEMLSWACEQEEKKECMHVQDAAS